MQKEYQDLIKDFIALLTERFGNDLVSVVLYGSVAKGTARKESDVDLCLVINNLPESRFLRNSLLTPLLTALQYAPSYKELRRAGYFPAISPILYTPEEIKETKPVFLDMVEDGEILVDDGTFKTKLDDLKEKMKALGSRRILRDDGTWYWVLKPGMKLGEVISL